MGEKFDTGVRETSAPLSARTFLAIVSVVVQRVAAVAGTAETADRVLTLVLASSVVDGALVAVCAQVNPQPTRAIYTQLLVHTPIQ